MKIIGSETLADAVVRFDAMARDPLGEYLRSDLVLAGVLAIACAAHPMGGLLRDT